MRKSLLLVDQSIRPVVEPRWHLDFGAAPYGSDRPATACSTLFLGAVLRSLSMRSTN
jgi:hypothetical protein